MNYSNSAGRLLLLLEAAKKVGNSNAVTFAKAYGVEPTAYAILRVNMSLFEELAELRQKIESFKDNKTKYNLYLSNFPAIERCVRGFVLGLQGDSYQANVDESGLVALRFIAADLPQESTISDEELDDLRTKIDELYAAAKKSALSADLRQWLFELCAVMKAALERYRLRGGRGVADHFHQMLGELFIHYPLVQELKKDNPGIWSRVTVVVEKISRMAEVVEKMQKAIGTFSKALPFLSDLAK